MRNTLIVAGVLTGLCLSVLALALAPALMPDSYSWLEHTTSESAAQGVDGAWLARFGFLAFGLSVLALAAARNPVWGPAGAWLHRGFGVFMVAAAVFSSRSWVAGAAYDPVEDVLHSVAATAMGFAFAVGIAAVLVHATREQRRRRWPLDALAVAAAVLLPLGMVGLPEAAGAFQRTMFAVAYTWYATEAVRGLR
jgi:hypothetical protein